MYFSYSASFPTLFSIMSPSSSFTPDGQTSTNEAPTDSHLTDLSGGIKGKNDSLSATSVGVNGGFQLSSCSFTPSPLPTIRSKFAFMYESNTKCNRCLSNVFNGTSFIAL